MFFGGLNIQKDETTLKSNCPHIVVGTPGRILALVRTKKLNLKTLKHFVLDECDKMLEALGKFELNRFRNIYSHVVTCFHADMRRDVQEIFRNTPHEKQVMMFSATLSKEIRPVCKKFMQDVITNFTTWPTCSKRSGRADRRSASRRRVVLEPHSDHAAAVTVPFKQFQLHLISRGRGWG